MHNFFFREQSSPHEYSSIIIRIHILLGALYMYRYSLRIRLFPNLQACIWRTYCDLICWSNFCLLEKKKKYDHNLPARYCSGSVENQGIDVYLCNIVKLCPFHHHIPRTSISDTYLYHYEPKNLFHAWLTILLISYLYLLGPDAYLRFHTNCNVINTLQALYSFCFYLSGFLARPAGTVGLDLKSLAVQPNRYI